MKNALVTGAAGFVGRHMVAALSDRGWSVHAVDIAHGSDAHDLFRESRERYDLVVHAAATAPHRAAIDGRPMNLAVDLALDAAMFEWAVRTGQRRALYLSSSAVYPVSFQDGSEAWHLHETNTDSPNGIMPDSTYGWTKLTGEKMADAARAGGLDVTVVRPFSGYGEDQGDDWPFGAFVARARRRADPFRIWGTGQQVRDWIHIDDVVAGALAMVEAGVVGPVNLCTGHGTSMLDLATMVCAAAGYVPWFSADPSAPTGVAYRVGDPDRMLEVYQPRVTLEEGVTRALQAVAA